MDPGVVVLAAAIGVVIQYVLVRAAVYAGARSALRDHFGEGVKDAEVRQVRERDEEAFRAARERRTEGQSEV